MTRARSITGTHVYSYVKCPHLAALDLSLPRSERRPGHEWEEFAKQRGRDFEAQFVAALGVQAPAYPERDFAAGAAATLALLRAGTPYVHQAVLVGDDRLGLPDLLRKIDGASDLGDFHYEVLDVKTSGRMRGDQVLQVVFYAQLLAQVQGRLPSHGGIVLKDGREERFRIADYTAACDEVLADLRRLRDDPARSRPFLQGGCSSCHYDHRCLPELTARGDLSLVAGMSRGARAILEGVGCRTVDDLAAFHPEGPRARGHLDTAVIRRLRRGAEALRAGAPLVEARPKSPNERLGQGALVHVLTDPYAERALAIGVLHPATADGRFAVALPAEQDDEWPAFERLIGELPARAPLLHFGPTLPRWVEGRAYAHEADPAVEARFVDLQKRLTGAAVYPRAVFDLPDLVRFGLGRDPLRAGHHGAAGLWAQQADGSERLRAKLHTDLLDLAELKARILDAAMPVAEAAAPAAAMAPAAKPPA
ncbi:MAG: TM0106 family RecB-like putative nuclease [Planctomycetes bacterium]|nr:TM0106 family RecB-like putative nuclease [Planctomycetota bacterium]